VTGVQTCALPIFFLASPTIVALSTGGSIDAPAFL